MDVVFRKDKTKDENGKERNTIFALFPHDVTNNQGNVTHYQHIGQHSSADYTHCIKTSIKATQNEYKDLKKELENIGYNLNIVQKRNYNKWLESYRNLN